MYIQDHFQAQSTDIPLCSSVKTGIAWLKALSFSIATRTQFNNSISPLQTKIAHQCIPFVDHGEDPKDNFVSLSHFVRKAARNNIKELKEGDLVSVEEAVELYCKGISFYGPIGNMSWGTGTRAWNILTRYCSLNMKT
ncbi:cytosolic sulfotransferase 16-like [Herrania umbratica]|uniref:Cytosolic sulfotransferase 16-like n=1 Tax=Herrania umbratica TaxID=108875 RepID=A0A6J1AWM3_9ROSI|nr:cytosolic sulfotransferase 16-like [Herrania umbratica]